MNCITLARAAVPVPLSMQFRTEHLGPQHPQEGPPDRVTLALIPGGGSPSWRADFRL